MGHKSFAIAFVLGLLALPLACGSDDDSPGDPTGGAGGSSGKTGTGGAGKGGTANGGGGGKDGTAGKDGVAGKGGSPGGAGEGGTGNTGNVGGAPEGGSGGDTGPSAGAGGTGAGGEAGGGATDPAAARLAQCTAVCNYPAPPDGYDGTQPPMPCTGDANQCATDLCNTTGWTTACVKVLDDLLACLATAPKTKFYCGDGDGLDGTLQFDGAASEMCPDTFAAYGTCISSP